MFPVTKVSHGNGAPCLSYLMGLPVPSSSWNVGMLVSIVGSRLIVLLGLEGFELRRYHTLRGLLFSRVVGSLRSRFVLVMMSMRLGDLLLG